MHPALADAVHRPFWLDSPDRPEPLPALDADSSADLVVVGGGYTGLWTALLAKERAPERDVVLLESRECGWAASGRNGGFCESSLTHGLANGAARFGAELATLERLGLDNLDAIEKTVARHGIDCRFERVGTIDVATADWQRAELHAAAGLARRYGHDVRLLERDEVRTEVDSPTFLLGLETRHRAALVDPARLAWGLRAACLRAGVCIFEGTPVTRLRRTGAAVSVVTPRGAVTAQHVVLATNAFPPLLRRLRAYVVPVYDYALVTEPLSPRQRESVGWARRQGLSDAGNQFHYFRLTPDDRILWGGYDAVYHFGNAVRDDLDARPATFARLARHFFETFPQLHGLRFTHAWGGVIDTCTRFSVFFGTAHAGRVAYAAGYTGLGVGATRFAAEAMLDVLAGERTERTSLELVRRKPRPLPPEPLRYAGIQATRWSLAHADARGGRRNAWLRSLDRLGLGFDS